MKNLEENYISAVVIVQNCASTLADQLHALNDALSGLFRFYEIIVVDNYSGDNTAQVLKEIQLPISIVTLARWHNTQAALTAGFEFAIGDYILEIPSLYICIDSGMIESLYKRCQQGNDFVFLVPKKTQPTSKLFYSLLNQYYKGQIGTQFVSSLMTLSSRRGQNKTADLGKRVVNRNVSYLLSGLKCAMVQSEESNSQHRSFRENFNLMTSTLIFYTDYITSVAFRAAMIFFSICVLAIMYSLVMFFSINTTPGWASTFILIAFGFGALFSLLAIMCKYLSSLIELQQPKNYAFSSIEKKESR